MSRTRKLRLPGGGTTLPSAEPDIYLLILLGPTAPAMALQAQLLLPEFARLWEESGLQRWSLGALKKCCPLGFQEGGRVNGVMGWSRER